MAIRRCFPFFFLGVFFSFFFFFSSVQRGKKKKKKRTHTNTQNNNNEAVCEGEAETTKLKVISKRLRTPCVRVFFFLVTVNKRTEVKRRLERKGKQEGELTRHLIFLFFFLSTIFFFLFTILTIIFFCVFFVAVFITSPYNHRSALILSSLSPRPPLS